jgi:TPR repeat protein
MKKSKIVVAVTLAINSSALFNAIPQASADEILAKNTLQEVPGIMLKSSHETPKDMTGDELLARGLARLTTAKKPLDYQTAYHFFEVAANKGVAEAQYQLALMQLDNDYVKGDEETAIHWLQEAIMQGHQRAAITLNWVTSAGDMVC